MQSEFWFPKNKLCYRDSSLFLLACHPCSYRVWLFVCVSVSLISWKEKFVKFFAVSYKNTEKLIPEAVNLIPAIARVSPLPSSSTHSKKGAAFACSSGDGTFLIHIRIEPKTLRLEQSDCFAQVQPPSGSHLILVQIVRQTTDKDLVRRVRHHSTDHAC